MIGIVANLIKQSLSDEHVATVRAIPSYRRASDGGIPDSNEIWVTLLCGALSASRSELDSLRTCQP